MIEGIIMGMFGLAFLLFMLYILWKLIKIFVYRVMAPRKWLVVLAREGEHTLADIGGAFWKSKLNKRGKHYDDDYWVVDGDGPQTLFDKMFPGLMYIGFSATLYEYDFSWLKVVDPGTGELQNRKERVSSIYYKDYNYGMKITKAETKGMVPIDLYFATLVSIVNPYIVRSGTADWLSVVRTSLVSHFNSYIGSLGSADALNEAVRSGSLGRKFFNYLKNEASHDDKYDNAIEEIMYLTGALIKNIDSLNVEYDPAYAEAAKQEAIEEKKGDAAVMRARKEGEAYEIMVGRKTRADLKRILAIGVGPAITFAYYEIVKPTDKTLILGQPNIGYTRGREDSHISVLKDLLISHLGSAKIGKYFDGLQQGKINPADVVEELFNGLSEEDMSRLSEMVEKKKGV